MDNRASAPFHGYLRPAEAKYKWKNLFAAFAFLGCQGP